MECTICHSPLTPEDKFCPFCGTKQEQEPKVSKALDVQEKIEPSSPQPSGQSPAQWGTGTSDQEAKPEQPPSQPVKSSETKSWYQNKPASTQSATSPSAQLPQNQPSPWGQNQPANQRPNAWAQQPANQQPNAWAQQPANQQPNAWAQQPANQQPNAWAQQPANQEPNAWGQPQGWQGNNQFYQDPLRSPMGQPLVKPRMSDPAHAIEPPNSMLNLVIWLYWIGFGLMVIVAVLFLAFTPITLIVTVPLTFLSYWLAKMLRRYNNNARIIALIFAALGSVSLLSGNMFALINIFQVYVLGFHQETQEQFNRYRYL